MVLSAARATVTPAPATVSAARAAASPAGAMVSTARRTVSAVEVFWGAPFSAMSAVATWTSAPCARKRFTMSAASAACRWFRGITNACGAELRPCDHALRFGDVVRQECLAMVGHVPQSDERPRLLEVDVVPDAPPNAVYRRIGPVPSACRVGCRQLHEAAAGAR